MSDATPAQPDNLTARERLERRLSRLTISEQGTVHVALQIASEAVLVGDMAQAAAALDQAFDTLGIVPL